MPLPNFGLFECFRGDGFVRKVVVKEAGAVKDISNWTLKFTAKASICDPDEDAVIDKDLVLTDATHGEATLTLTADDTALDPGSYPFAIKIIQEGGEPPRSIGGTLVIVETARQGV